MGTKLTVLSRLLPYLTFAQSDADTSKSIHGSQLLAFVPTTCEGVQLVYLGFPLGLTSRIGVPRNRHRDRIVGSDHVGGHFKPRAA